MVAASVCTGVSNCPLDSCTAMGSIPYVNKNSRYPNGHLLFLVEVRGIEPLSEGNLERLSPGAVCYLHSLIPAGTNTLRNLVAS